MINWNTIQKQPCIRKHRSPVLASSSLVEQCLHCVGNNPTKRSRWKKLGCRKVLGYWKKQRSWEERRKTLLPLGKKWFGWNKLDDLAVWSRSRMERWMVIRAYKSWEYTSEMAGTVRWQRKRCLIRKCKYTNVKKTRINGERKDTEG